LRAKSAERSATLEHGVTNGASTPPPATYEAAYSGASVLSSCTWGDGRTHSTREREREEKCIEGKVAAP
jgi:hypothetical protein